MKAPTIAVDFGTTRTKVAFFDEKDEQPRLIELGRANLQVIPSLFYVPRDPRSPRLVGDDAQEMVDEDPEGIVENLKKEIHRSGKLRFGPDRPAVDRVELAGELFAYLRRRCRDEVFYSDVTSCVLTLPVVFEEQKRECIRRAAEWGGFRCDQIRFIEEPVAAARAWLWQWEGEIASSVIVCDVGGGTTDFSLLRYLDVDFEPVPELAKGGLPQGGNDLDESILQESLARQPEHRNRDGLRMALLNKFRQLKERFVRDTRQLFSVRLQAANIEVPREVIESQTQQFVERVAEEFRRFVRRCGTVADLSGTPVLLVGGASRTTGLKEAIEQASPGKVYQWNKSDYAASLGAALLSPCSGAKALAGGAARRGSAGADAASVAPPLAVFSDPGAYLADAVRRADAGMKIALPAGEYRLPQPLIVERPLEIAGLGRERSMIRWEGEGPAIICRGECALTLRDVTVQRIGQRREALLDAVAGRVTIEDSRICGARAGSGIRLRGEARAEVRRCLIDGNGQHGIVLEESAEGTLEENTCEKNGAAGIQYQNAVGGIARKNICRENHVCGIGIGEKSTPLIEENTCEKNARAGIQFQGDSSGTAQENTCSLNHGCGIAVYSSGIIVLEANGCHGNGDSGIYLNGAKARNTAISGNTCKGNTYGIQIGSGAWSGVSTEAELFSGQTRSDCEASNTCENNSQGNWSWNVWFR
ncbi:MAG: right-handed parallel beta-helix repeat-containing protein [Thermoguttaceae bacterium]|nr:right-handed parallel beta-helix repeat-containing protein [Thermoguttaceae bacterium]